MKSRRAPVRQNLPFASDQDQSAEVGVIDAVSLIPPESMDMDESLLLSCLITSRWTISVSIRRKH